MTADPSVHQTAALKVGLWAGQWDGWKAYQTVAPWVDRWDATTVVQRAVRSGYRTVVQSAGRLVGSTDNCLAAQMVVPTAGL